MRAQNRNLVLIRRTGRQLGFSIAEEVCFKMWTTLRKSFGRTEDIWETTEAKSSVYTRNG